MVLPVLQVTIGIWVILSPWVLGWNGIPVIMWSNLLSGCLMVVFGVWQIFGREERSETKGHINSKSK